VGEGVREVSYYKNGYEAGDGCVPVPTRRRLADQHTVEYEITQAEFHTSCKNTKQEEFMKVKKSLNCA